VNKDPRSGLLFVVSAPSGAGKTTLVNALLEAENQLVASVSHTTRSRRPQEHDGVNYHFVSEAEFRDMLDADEFLEHAVVFGHYYGTAKSAVDEVLAQGRDVILEIDWQGAEQVRQSYPDCCSIFILPPSRAALRERLHARGQDSPEVIAKRTAEAREEMANHGAFDYIVVNEDFSSALDDLRSIINATRLGRIPKQQELRSLLADLLADP
jgi:guanylate kinase